MQGPLVWSLVGELRSHVPHRVAPPQKKEKATETNLVSLLGVFYKFISEATMYHHSAWFSWSYRPAHCYACGSGEACTELWEPVEQRITRGHFGVWLLKPLSHRFFFLVISHFKSVFTFTLKFVFIILFICLALFFSFCPYLTGYGFLVPQPGIVPVPPSSGSMKF